MDRPRVSLCMIVRDGAATLDRCLASAAGLVDEFVAVVDSATTDDSAAIVERHGGRVVSADWTDSFADARNVSLDAARGDWVIWLDADEWLDAPARAGMASLIAGLQDARRVYLMEQVSPLGECGPGEVRIAQARLFRRDPAVRWAYRLHEQILPSCLRAGYEVRRTNLVIRHSGYECLAVSRTKEERIVRLAERDLAERPDDPWVLYQLGRMYARERFPEARVLLEKGLRLANADDPVRRPMFGQLVRGLYESGEVSDAEAWLRAGLEAFPNDTELLTLDGCLGFAAGDLARAEAAYRGLLGRPADPDATFAAVDPSLRGWQARLNLAAVHRAQGRPAEAEMGWREVVEERPDAAPAWIGLAEVLLGNGRWHELGVVVDRLEALGEGAATLIRAQVELGRGEHEAATRMLIDLSIREAGNVVARLLLARACLEGDDFDGAEAALRDALAIDPANATARRGLEALGAA